MLKWAINEPRQSYFPCTPDQIRGCAVNDLDHISTSSFHYKSTGVTHSLQGQSMESVCLESNKENQVTSTPLHACSSSPAKREQHKETPRIRKLDSFRDLSNIYPEYTQNITPQRRPLAIAGKCSENRYASTLPTLDVNEYSPSCDLIPGPLLALRGIGIPDAYFEKPRYLTQHDLDHDDDVENVAPHIATPQIKLKLSPPKSLSSSQMDESTLEHMIDAIIASTQKDNKLPMKSSKYANRTIRSCSMSPTYTPAFDPASDLDELWWNTDRAYFRTNNITLTQSSSSEPSCEHILRTPKTHKFPLLNSAFKRRRQRPVRRKRRFTNFRNTVKRSARKLLRVGSNVSISMPQLYEDNEDESGTQSHTNPSPDSGHNSSSADSTKTDDQETKDQLTNKEATDVEVTKRRLSFSKPHCN